MTKRQHCITERCSEASCPTPQKGSIALPCTPGTGQEMQALTCTSVPSPGCCNPSSCKGPGSVPCPGSTVPACWGGTLRHFWSPIVSDPCGEVPGAKEALGEGRCSGEEAFSVRGRAEPTGMEEGSANLASELSAGIFCWIRSADVCCGL